MFNILLPVYLLIIQCSMISNLVNAKDFRDTNNRWRNFESLSRTRLLVVPGKGPTLSTSTTQSTTLTSSSTQSSLLYFSAPPALGKKLEFYRFPFERVTLNKNSLYPQIHIEEKPQDRVEKDAHFSSTEVTTQPPTTLLTRGSIIFDEIYYNNENENTTLHFSSPDSFKSSVPPTFLNPPGSQGHANNYQKDDHIVDGELVEFFTSTEIPIAKDNTDSFEVDSWYTTTIPDVIGLDILENVLKRNGNSYPLEESLNSLGKVEDSMFTTSSEKFVTTAISNGLIDNLDVIDEDIIDHNGENSTTNLLTIANISINSTTILIFILLVAVIFLYVKSNKTSVDKDGTKYWTNFPTIQVADKQKIFPMPCSLISKNEIEKMKASYF